MVVEELHRLPLLLRLMRRRRQQRQERRWELEEVVVVRCFASFGLSPFFGDGVVRRWWWNGQSGERPCFLLEPIGQEFAQRLLVLR